MQHVCFTVYTEIANVTPHYVQTLHAYITVTVKVLGSIERKNLIFVKKTVDLCCYYWLLRFLV